MVQESPLKVKTSWQTIVRSVAAGLGLFILGSAPSAAESGSVVSFRNEVMPLMSKAGCNAGTCHGNANGKGGFKLSLRGQDPDLDWLALTRDQSGRRVNSLSPTNSLILLKGSTALAHEGGQRFHVGSESWRLLASWISAGANDDGATAPKLIKLEVTPHEQVLIEPKRGLKLKARAIFSDGSQRDVSSVAVYDPANFLLTVSPEGLVTSLRPGETTVNVRFLDKQMPVRLAFVPKRPNFKWIQPPVHNFVDEQIFSKLAAATEFKDRKKLGEDLQRSFYSQVAMVKLGYTYRLVAKKKKVLDPNGNLALGNLTLNGVGFAG